TVSASYHISSLSLHDALPILSDSLNAEYSDEIRRLFTKFNELKSCISCTVFPVTDSTKSKQKMSDMTSPTPQVAALITRGKEQGDRKSTRLNSSHVKISYAVF